MHPDKVDRTRLHRLTDLPNVGPRVAHDLQMLGMTEPQQLQGKDPYVLFEQLCTLSGCAVDPCMLDTFISLTRFMAGDDAKPWWHYTAERKQTLAQRTS